MSLLRVDTASLQAIAAKCDTWSVDLRSSNRGVVPGPPCQATVAAVRTAESSVAAIARALSARMQATGANLRSAAATFERHEEESAAGFNHLTTKL